MSRNLSPEEKRDLVRGSRALLESGPSTRTLDDMCERALENVLFISLDVDHGTLLAAVAKLQAAYAHRTELERKAEYETQLGEQNEVT